MTRDELYQKFGPKLIDAFVQTIWDEINVLRAEQGFRQRSKQQVIDVIANKLENIPDYDWMKERYNGR